MNDRALDPISARIGQLRLRDLMLLEHVDRLGTLAKVGEAMHVTQPAVTQALQVLERAFGVPLVLRERRGASLTPAGRAALTRLRAAGQEVQAAHAAALAPQSPLLRIGSSPMGTVNVLPAALRRLRKAVPEVRVVISETSVPELWHALAQGTLDAIVSRLPNIGQGESLPDAVVYDAVGQERIVLVAARSHPLARRKPTLEALAQAAWVLPPQGSLAVAMFNDWFTRGGLRPPEVAITSVSFLSNLRLAGQCAMLTLAPESSARAHAAAMKLKIIATPWAAVQGDIVFACREASLANPLIATARECFAPAQEAKRAPVRAPLKASGTAAASPTRRS